MVGVFFRVVHVVTIVTYLQINWNNDEQRIVPPVHVFL